MARLLLVFVGLALALGGCNREALPIGEAHPDSGAPADLGFGGRDLATAPDLAGSCPPPGSAQVTYGTQVLTYAVLGEVVCDTGYASALHVFSTPMATEPNATSLSVELNPPFSVGPHAVMVNDYGAGLSKAGTLDISQLELIDDEGGRSIIGHLIGTLTSIDLALHGKIDASFCSYYEDICI